MTASPVRVSEAAWSRRPLVSPLARLHLLEPSGSVLPPLVSQQLPSESLVWLSCRQLTCFGLQLLLVGHSAEIHHSLQGCLLLFPLLSKRSLDTASIPLLLGLSSVARFIGLFIWLCCPDGGLRCLGVEMSLCVGAGRQRRLLAARLARARLSRGHWHPLADPPSGSGFTGIW